MTTSANEFLRERVRTEQGLALGAPTITRAYHEGVAAGYLYAMGDFKHAAALMAELRHYRGTAALRAQEGFRIGHAMAEAVLDYAKVGARS